MTDFLLQKKHVRITHNFAAHTNIDNVTMTDNCGKKTCHFLVVLFCFDEKNHSFLEEIRYYCPLVLVKNGFEKMVGVIFGCKQEHHNHIHIFLRGTIYF